MHLDDVGFEGRVELHGHPIDVHVVRPHAQLPDVGLALLHRRVPRRDAPDGIRAERRHRAAGRAVVAQSGARDGRVDGELLRGAAARPGRLRGGE
eukprot:6051018-Prymnesium_polylepis.1